VQKLAATAFSTLFAAMDVKEDPAMHVISDLKFLQLLCEGHQAKNQVRGQVVLTFVSQQNDWCLRKQHYLRVQTSSGKSYDVITQLCKYFVCLEQYVTEGSLKEMIQCVDTLTETIQGPCRENQAVLLDNKVLDAAMRVLAWSPADLAVRNG
jgi:RyR and IP3R Homology associated